MGSTPFVVKSDFGSVHAAAHPTDSGILFTLHFHADSCLSRLIRDDSEGVHAKSSGIECP